MNVCVIDIGSNTVKANVFSISSNGRREALDCKGCKVKLVASIAESDGKRILTDEGKRKLNDALEVLLDFSKSYLCQHVFAFATASLRNVDNASDVLCDVKTSFDLDVEILSGEEEALCSLRGLLSNDLAIGVREGIMVDMGGGSTEVVFFSNGTDPQLVSLPFGCVSLCEGFVKGNVPTDSERSAIEAYVKAELSRCGYAHNRHCPMFLIGGSGRAVCKVVNGSSENNSLRIDGSDFLVVLDKFKEKGYFENADSIIPGRAKTVCPAAIAFRMITEFVSPSSLAVCDSGVREGYLEKILP